ncbi:hypothetical protein BGZ76_010875 [Entomortierella beljakovae]|nr:hypothetical protein BGZ76_010875 [Entomortierella beljakovae]
MVRLIIGLAACAAMALADVTFNVVGLRENNGDEFGVLINGELTKLATSEDTYPLWSANVAGVNAPVSYKYVHIKNNKNEEETRPRQLSEGAAHTPNDFFGRETIHSLPPLPQAFESNLEQNSPFFREGYIGTIFVEGDQDKWKYLNKGGNDPNPYNVTVRYIGANDNIKIDHVSLGVSGQSAREYAKQAYQFKFPKKNRLLDLSTLKLRNEETDATMMREKLYVDILNSLGVPTQQAAYVRLYYNEEPVGLYVAVEEMKKHWVKKVLHPGVKAKPGAIWKMNSCCGKEGNLEWLGPKTDDYMLRDIYRKIHLGGNPKDDPMRDLIKFMHDLKEYNPEEVADPIAFWEEKLDLDTFLKSMAMEYLAGSWDSYWGSGSNYQMYKNPVTGKWTWLPTDFDDTFGTSFPGVIESYRKIPKKNENGFESPLAQKLIMETPQINARFEEILKDIVSYVFKPAALHPRLDAYKAMIEDDISWDRDQPRLAKGKNNKFTVEDLSKGLEKGTKGNWGVKKWIEDRSLQVQKDLNFKASGGNPTKFDHHTVTNLQSPFGILSSEPSKGVSPSMSKDQTPLSVGNVAKAASPSGSSKDTITSSSSNEPQSAGAATTYKSYWSALSAVIAVATLLL